MSNMMDDYPSSSYSSDDSAFDMFSDMFDSSDRMDNYRSSSDYKNPMGRMSQFKNMFNSMRFKRAAGEAGRAEAPHGGQDRQHDLCHEGVERPGRQQQHRCAGTRTSRTRLSPTLVQWRTSCRRPSSPSTSSSHLSCSCCTARRWTT